MASRFSAITIIAIVVVLVLQKPVRAAEASPAKNLIANPELAAGTPDGSVAGWSFWSPRKALASGSSRDGKMLCLSCERFEQYGAWTTEVPNIEPGHFYRFEVLHRAKGVSSEDVSVGVILTWHKAGEYPHHTIHQ